MATSSKTSRSPLDWQRLEAENRLLREIVERVPCGVTANTIEGDFLLINNAATEINAVDRVVALSMNDKDVFGGENSLMFDNGGGSDSQWLNYIVSTTGEAIEDVPIVFTRPDGTKKYTVMSVYPLLEDGKVVSTFCIANDLQHAQQMSNIVDKYTTLKNPAHKGGTSYATRYTFDDFLAADEATLQCIANARRAALVELPTMIIGETGSGKEIIAQGMHAESAASKGPFVPINCAAIPEGLVESVFFGSVEGAFTGATDVAGLFEQADGGTLFLDEVNSLPLAFQAKLLRVLQEMRVRRVGATHEKPFDCRIISASNVDLTLSETWSEFRQDLFYRLAVVTIQIPPLRRRKGDIALLATHYIARYEMAVHHRVNGLAPEVLKAFAAYDWPGNVRELQNVIASSMSIMDEDSDVIELHHLPPRYRIVKDGDPGESVEGQPSGHFSDQVDDEGVSGVSLGERVEAFERREIAQALADAQGSVAQAARALGVNRTALYAKLKKLGLDSGH